MLGLLDEELHVLGHVLDMLVQGLHDEELHAVGQVVHDKVEFPERGQSQVSRIYATSITFTFGKG